MFLLAAMLLPVCTSCVYFNTYYNAKRYFREGVRDNEELAPGQQPQVAKFQKSLDSAARVLEYYPKSKYVDDALMLMGKSYYYIKSYPSAIRKFEELLANYPTSPLLHEARLYIGKTLIASDRVEEGLDYLAKLWGEKIPEEVRIESQRTMADYNFEKENYRQALTEYQKTLEAQKNERARADLSYQIGECLFLMGDYDNAEAAYLQVLKEKPTRKRQFEAIFKRALTLDQQGDYSEALAICERLLKKDIYFSYVEPVYLAKANLLNKLGRSEEAIQLYEKTIQLYPRTDTSAKACYFLGEIYLHDLADFTKAEEYLAKVATEKAQSEFADSAATQVADLRLLKALSFSIDSLYADVDTLNYHLGWLAEQSALKAMDSLNVSPDSGQIKPDTLLQLIPDSSRIQFDPFLQHEDSLALIPELPSSSTPMSHSQTPGLPTLPFGPGGNPKFGMNQPLVPTQQPTSQPPPTLVLAPLPNDSAAVYSRIVEDQEMLATFRFRLAEHLRLQFNNNDSARVLLTDLAAQSDYPDVQARSLLVLYQMEPSAEDSTALDSLLKLVHTQFEDSEYDRWVRPKLGLEPLPQPVDTAAERYRYAEKLWMESNLPDSAVIEYLALVEDYSQTDWGHKALFAAAWVQEHVLEDFLAAMATYDSLISRYPQSPHVALAKKKIAPPPPELPDTTEAVADSTVQEVLEFALGPTPEGSGNPVLLGGDAVLQDYIHKNHLYPLVAMEAEILGEVIVSLLVDAQGNPKNFAVVSENPEGFDFGTMAIEALKGMKFVPGYAGGQYLESQTTQTVRFIP
ncbi:MAG: tetratricopeptide repeat protein [bacterium]